MGKFEKKVEEIEEIEEDAVETPVRARATPKQIEDYMNERVAFYAIKDNGKYKDDVIVQVNGTNYVYQRGKNLMIPRFVKMVIDQSQDQDNFAINEQQKMLENYEIESKKFGM